MDGFSGYSAYAEAIAARNFAILGALVVVVFLLAIIWIVRRWRESSGHALAWILIGAFYATLAYSLIWYHVSR